MRAPSTSRLVFGLGITFVGIVLLLDRLGISRAQVLLHFWPVGLVLFGAALVLQAFRRGPAYYGPGRPRRSHFGLAIWVLVLGALFSGSFHDRNDSVVRADTRENPQVFALLNGSQRTNVATRFRGADMTAVMGGSDLDLRRAVLAPGQEATVDVFALMGGVTLRVPDGWDVDVRVTPIMGGVKDQRWPRQDGDLEQSAVVGGPAPRLIVKGFVVMGGLIVKS
jgi:hypothetical protein